MMQAKIERELLGYVPGVERREMKFDDAWQLYNEVSGNPHLLKDLIQRGLIDTMALTNLALKDLEYSLNNAPHASNEIHSNTHTKHLTHGPSSSSSHLHSHSSSSSSSASALITHPSTTKAHGSVNDTHSSSHPISHEDDSLPSAPPSLEFEEEMELNDIIASHNLNNAPNSEIDATSNIIALHSANALSKSSRHFSRWPTLPALTGKNTHVTRTLIFRMRKYSSFLISHVDIPSAIISAALDADAEMRSMSFEQALDEGACDLIVGSSPLLNPAFIRSKCIEFLSKRTTTFDKFVVHNGRFLLENSIVEPSLVGPLFNRDCIQKLTCVALLDEWYEWPIKAYGKEMGLDEKLIRLLASLSSQLQTARLHFSSEVESYRDTQARDLKKAKKRKAKEVEKLLIKVKTEVEAAHKETAGSKNKAKRTTNSHQPPTSVTVQESLSEHPTMERLDAEFDLEEMRIEETYDHAALGAKRRLENAENHINSSWNALIN